jgi:hypothetical protein
VNHPPHGQKSADSKFAGKEWRELTIGELITDGEVSWAEMDTSVEEATKVRFIGGMAKARIDMLTFETLAPHPSSRQRGALARKCRLAECRLDVQLY